MAELSKKLKNLFPLLWAWPPPGVTPLPQPPPPLRQARKNLGFDTELAARHS